MLPWFVPLAGCRASLPSEPALAPGPAEVADAPPPAPPPPPYVDLARATVVAVGDTMMHGSVQSAARQVNDATKETPSTNHEGYQALFAGVAGLVSAADLAFTNLETPIAPKTGRPVIPMVFNAPPSVLGALAATGFDVVSTANNHSWDQGVKGLLETHDHLDASPLVRVGTGANCAEARAHHLFERNGVKIALIGSCTLYNQDLGAGPDRPCVYTLTPESALAEVQVARDAGADLVVLSVHWGVEYATSPMAEQRDWARQLVEGGVDVILGHHPHVLQPVELIEAADGRTGLVAYSLGNFISSQSAQYRPGVQSLATGYTRDGALLRFSVVKRSWRDPSGGPDRIRAELQDVEVIPLWTLNTNFHPDRESPTIQVVPTLERIRTLEARVAAATDPDDAIEATRELEDLRRQVYATSKILGAGWVRGYTPPDEGEGGGAR
jgi:poly-gamma-glutamate synthesis protein (capsule biosynthesis protein)